MVHYVIYQCDRRKHHRFTIFFSLHYCNIIDFIIDFIIYYKYFYKNEINKGSII